MLTQLYKRLVKNELQSAPERRASTQERIHALVDEVLTGTPYYLVELAVRGAKGSQVVDVFLESDNGIGVDDLARFSRELGFLLETEDVLGGHYRLNVSSPGVGKPLKVPRQYKNNIGRTLELNYREKDQYTSTSGVLVSVSDSGIEVNNNGKMLAIAFEDLAWAKVQLPW